jgi:abortive infection bacteriophage resistance protein
VAEFPKNVTTHAEQLQLLKDRGLVIDDEAVALRRLAHFSYYRLSGYRFPFTPIGKPDEFVPGTRFQDLWDLYVFDRELRQLVSGAVKLVEISSRCKWAHEFAHAYDPFAYADPQYFTDKRRYFQQLQKLDDELSRS